MTGLERDHDNFRAALQWLILRGDAESSMSLAGALWSFWEKRGYWNEGIRWLESCLALPGGDSPPVRARALIGLAIMHRERSEYALAAQYGWQSVALQRQIENCPTLPSSLIMLGEIVAMAGDPFSGAELVAEVTRLREGDALAQAWSGLVEGYIATYRGDFEAARRFFEEAMSFRHGESGNEVDANLLHALGVIHAGGGNRAEARRMFEEALNQFRARGEMRGVARVLQSLGALLARCGDSTLARAVLEESISTFRNLGEAVGVALCSLMLGQPLPEGMLAELGPHALTIWWHMSVGRAAPAEDDLSGWCLVPSEIPTVERRSTAQQRLTRRELEVLALIKRHYSNKQIADELVLSIRTVERHITNIYAKTGLSSRRLAETYADYVFT